MPHAFQLPAVMVAQTGVGESSFVDGVRAAIQIGG